MPDIPDRISEEALRSFLESAERPFPEAANAPSFTLRGLDAGVLDFSVVLQAILNASEGGNLTQLSQATLFLLHAIRAIHAQVLESMEEPEAHKLPPHIRASVIEKSSHDLKVTEAIYTMLESVSAPVMGATIAYKVKASGKRPSALLIRQCLISDDVCQRLGLDPGEMASYFEDSIRELLGR